MIFVANILALNGGTTFLVRICKELKARSNHCAVVVLRDGGDTSLAAALEQHATILRLADFQVDRGRVFKRHLGTFAPISWSRLGHALAPYGSTIHAMGAFGLIFAARLARYVPTMRVTAGIYHQNEYIFHDRPVFSRQILSLFRNLPPENVLFFNESGRDNYSLFHSIDYNSTSLVSPIGIEISYSGKAERKNLGCKIISIGSLEKFKAYNRNIISILPELKAMFPEVSYHIYGNGECLDLLRMQAEELGVGEHVTFHGALAYERFYDVVRAGDVFVGSGTALVEAAAAGRPALVGVESIKNPVTYGFLSDIKGLSYNEAGIALPMRPMLDYLKAIFSDPDQWQATADACFAKAQDFSVERTVDSLFKLADDALPTPSLISSGSVVRLLTELPMLSLWDKVSPEFAFAQRRNQSFQR